jgi:hypothetical protein
VVASAPQSAHELDDVVSALHPSATIEAIFFKRFIKRTLKPILTQAEDRPIESH